MIWVEDLILYLVPFLDYHIVSLFVTNKVFVKFYQRFDQLLLDSAILREAHRIDRNLKPGSRVYSDKNYKIIVINEMLAAVQVNKYGKRLNNVVKQVYRDRDQFLVDGSIVKSGFKLDNFGPLIEACNSYYFKYKYDPINIGFKIPEVNMLVVVRLYSVFHEYVITELSEFEGVMETEADFKHKNLGKYADLTTKLKLGLVKIDNVWVTEDGFDIVRFGGFL